MRIRLLAALLLAPFAASAAVVEVRLETPASPSLSYSAPALAVPGFSAPSLSVPSLTPAQVLATPVPGVSFQIEQEGNVLRSDLKDSSGNVFRYYRPVEVRPELLEASRAGMAGIDRAGYALRTLWGLTTRSDPERMWDAMPLAGKLDYLDRLEKAVVSERGADAAWKGKTFKLLKSGKSAPDFVAEHPDMEEPPSGRREGTDRFLQPEIVSAKDKPAATAKEAIGRTRRVIADTGHAGTQYHVFMKLAPAELDARLGGLLSAVAAYNEVLFLEAAADSPDNLLHGSLKPWHAGRARRVRELVAAKGAARQPSWKDFDSEKHAYLGVRWWGMEDGKAVISLELRGASIPWKKTNSAMTRGVEGAAPEMRRDYSHVERWLATLASAAAGNAPAAAAAPLELDAEAAAASLGVAAADLEALSAALGAGPGVHPALIYPLAAGGADGYAAALRREVLTLKAQGPEEFNARLAKYTLWSEFAGWAGKRLPAARRAAAL